MSNQTPQTEAAPGIFGHLSNALEAIDTAQNQCRAAATLLGLNAGVGAVDAASRRAKAARLQELIAGLEEIAEAVQDTRGWDLAR